MSSISTSNQDSTIAISQFVGLHECEAGDTNIGIGESSYMKNYKCTHNMELKKREGTALMYQLGEYENYAIPESRTSVSVPEGGLLEYETAGLSDIEYVYNFNLPDYQHSGDYCVFNFYPYLSELKSNTTYRVQWTLLNDSPYCSTETDPDTHNDHDITNLEVRYLTPLTAEPNFIVESVQAEEKISRSYDFVWTGNSQSLREHWFSLRWPKGDFGQDRETGELEHFTISVKCLEVDTSVTATDYDVKMLWHGYINGCEEFIAACEGVVYRLYDGNCGYWYDEPVPLGELDSCDHCSCFEFNDVLYFLDGENYFKYDGNSFNVVNGYVPLVLTEVTQPEHTTHTESFDTQTCKIDYELIVESDQVYDTSDGTPRMTSVLLDGTALTLDTAESPTAQGKYSILVKDPKTVVIRLHEDDLADLDGGLIVNYNKIKKISVSYESLETAAATVKVVTSVNWSQFLSCESVEVQKWVNGEAEATRKKRAKTALTYDKTVEDDTEVGNPSKGYFRITKDSSTNKVAIVISSSQFSAKYNIYIGLINKTADAKTEIFDVEESSTKFKMLDNDADNIYKITTVKCIDDYLEFEKGTGTPSEGYYRVERDDDYVYLRVNSADVDKTQELGIQVTYLIFANQYYSTGNTLEEINLLTGVQRATMNIRSGQNFYYLWNTCSAIKSVDRVYLNSTLMTKDEGSYPTASGHYTVIWNPNADCVKIILHDDDVEDDLTAALEVYITLHANYRDEICSSLYAEKYSGSTDNIVMLYGGDNIVYYSEPTTDGNTSAEYFPALNQIAVGDDEDPVMMLARHYSSLVCWKKTEAWNITLSSTEDSWGNTKYTWALTPLNKVRGMQIKGGVQLVNDMPITYMDGSLYSWQNNSYYSSTLSRVEGQCSLWSDKIQETCKDFDDDRDDLYTFDNNYTHEYWLCDKNRALVCLYENSKRPMWYYYEFPFSISCMMATQDAVYFGTNDGMIIKMHEDYMNDCGEAIEAYWESGSMDFGATNMRKFSQCIWALVQVTGDSYTTFSCITDRTSKVGKKAAETDTLDFSSLDFSAFDFNPSAAVKPVKVKMKAKKYVFYKLIIESNKLDTSSSVLKVTIPVRTTGRSK